ncbi:hypothetical protein TRFO_42962 [Tritrichomonas foetus]|uniref:Sperm-tail PG-rich repeat family protein n=1 Tax=Tritrichomonas foetus TaxID=1144522 RepID=A0A1J4KTL5_9EUKA|nr:hypothetical protein TRFO_42962 [Tritrichomonas foetus]|eukprot:OHT14603.1 hypothetical protein TRFO_42962 [Tritrichomonas foetus]
MIIIKIPRNSFFYKISFFDLFSPNIKRAVNNVQIYDFMIYALTTSRNFTNVIRNTPEELGPGSYEIIPKMGNKKKMKAPFGSKTTNREIFPRPELEPPSPGEYEPKPLSSSIKIASVFQSESPRKFFTPQKTPSPADYGKIEDWKKAPQKPSQKKLRTARPPSGFIGQDVTCYSINQNGEWVPIKKEKRGPEFIGPGSYTPIEYPTNYRISMDTNAKREIFVNRENVPDPCKYSPSKRNDKLPVAIRELSRSAPIDGGEPAFVNLKTWVSSNQEEGSPAFRNREKRKAFPDPEPTPSPTVYYHPSKREYKPGNSFGHKMDRKFTAIEAKVDTPGPGAYEGKTINWIKGTTGTTPRSNTTLDYSEKTPGPGSYIKVKTWDKSKRPSSVFQSRTKRELDRIEILPGSADYSPQITDHNRAIPPLIHESRNSTLGNWVSKDKCETPAPDVYQHIDFNPGKGITIPYKYRDDDSDNRIPGPGAYNVIHGSLDVKSYNSYVRKQSKK